MKIIKRVLLQNEITFSTFQDIQLIERLKLHLMAYLTAPQFWANYPFSTKYILKDGSTRRTQYGMYSEKSRVTRWRLQEQQKK